MLLSGDGWRKLREKVNSRTIYYVDAGEELAAISKHHDERS
jgi:hypothetical protein